VTPCHDWLCGRKMNTDSYFVFSDRWTSKLKRLVNCVPFSKDFRPP
jgi:hypothetical protein